jgi:hypothetical protein
MKNSIVVSLIAIDENVVPLRPWLEETVGVTKSEEKQNHHQ